MRRDHHVRVPGCTSDQVAGACSDLIRLWRCNLVSLAAGWAGLISGWLAMVVGLARVAGWLAGQGGWLATVVGLASVAGWLGWGGKLSQLCVPLCVCVCVVGLRQQAHLPGRD